MGGEKLSKLEGFSGGRCKFMKELHNLGVKSEEYGWRVEWGGG